MKTFMQALPKDFLFLIVILFCSEFVRGAYLISFLPAYTVDQLGLSVAAVGVAVSAHYVTDTIGKSFIGWLLDHFSARLIVLSGMLISLAGLILTLHSHQPWMLVLTAALYGVGVSPIWIVALGKVREGQRAAQMGALYSLWLVGLGSGPVFLNFFIGHGFQLSFDILIGVWIFALLLSSQISREKLSAVDMIPLRQQIQTLFERLKKMKPLLPGMILQTTAAGMLVPILPIFATENLGLSYNQYSYVLIAGGACTVIGLIPMGKLSDRVGKKWFLVVGFAAFTIALFFLTKSQSFYSAVVWAVVLGISYAAVLPAWNALLSYQVPDDQQGLGWGVFSSIEGVGIMMGPTLGGWLADWHGTTLTVWVSAAMLGMIALFYLFYPFHRLVHHHS